jgi:hypothetical protein
MELSEEFDSDERPRAVQEQDFVFEALSRLHAQATLISFEVQACLRSGFPSAARARWRTLHEIVVSMEIIGRRERDIAERFLSHSAIEIARDADVYQEHYATLGHEPLVPNELLKIYKQRDETLDRFNDKDYAKDYGWGVPLTEKGNAPTFRWLEKEAGFDHMRPLYRDANHRIHAGSRAHSLQVFRRGPHRLVSRGPVNIGLEEVGHGVLISLTQATIILTRATPDPGLVGLWVSSHFLN